jgi:hypothetical protein
MTFELFGFDCWFKEKIFGIWLFGLEFAYDIRHLFCIHYNSGEWHVELFFKSII